MDLAKISQGLSSLIFILVPWGKDSYSAHFGYLGANGLNWDLSLRSLAPKPVIHTVLLSPIESLS